MCPEKSKLPASICLLAAADIVGQIKQRTLSCVQVMEAFLSRIDALNPTLNAIPIRVPNDQALLQAEAADQQLADGRQIGPLHGLPMAIKDLVDVKGLRTTHGSPLFADYMASADSLFVERLRDAGVIFIGKTNVPEFGAGSHTFNPLFGATRNPYNLQKSAGGSSGGAAAAVATGMLPFADGNDMGGSLRNPAAFNNIFSIRPTVGRVPTVGRGWMTRHATDGPLARSVADACLLLSVMAGHDNRDPLSIREPGDQFLAPLQRDFTATRVGWGSDMGCMVVEPEILAVCRRSIPIFEQLGCRVDDERPDLNDAMDVFQVQRALGNLARLSELSAIRPDWRSLVKETVLWNIEKGLELTAEQISRSDCDRARIFSRIQSYFQHHDFLILPTTQVAPFDIELDWVREINGETMDTYIDWMRSCCIITVTGCPAASVPCGFTRDGLPVGLQIVGKPWHDFDVLQLAFAFEQAIQIKAPTPYGS